MPREQQPPASAIARPARDWGRLLAPYRASSTKRAVFELLTTLIPFIGGWAILAWSVARSNPWPVVVLVVPTALLVVRIFAIQHDCGHGSFFPKAAANDWTGRVLGVVTLAPYGYWRRTHAIHHASSGNLDARGIGDVDTLTVAEYLGRSAWGRWRYRAYRHPLVLFGLGPAYLFVLQYRLPIGTLRQAQPWISALGTNVAILAVTALLIWSLGLGVFLLVQLPLTLISASIGVWLFYVQHQFEHTQWDRAGTWSVHEAALHGSSHYDMPPLLRWFTGNLGIHHIHHLVSRIPFYRLGHVLRDHPELHDIGRITIRQSLGCSRLALWDEDRKELVSFAALRADRAVKRAVAVPMAALEVAAD